MRHASLFTAPTTAALLGVTLLVGPPAAAGEARPSRVVLHDAAADVWQVDVRTSEWTEVGALPAADVRKAIVRHTPLAVTVRMRLADLRRVGRQGFAAGFVTREGILFSRVLAAPGNRAGRYVLRDEPGGTRIPCPGLTHRLDYAEDLVTMRVPRSCIGNPPWVRVNLGNTLVLGDEPPRRHLADNPHDASPYSNVGTRRLYPG